MTLDPAPAHTGDRAHDGAGRPSSGSAPRSALARCIDVSPEVFASEYWGRQALLSPASGLYTDFSDLFSAAAVDELVSERGLRTPFIRMAQEGSVLPSSSFTASGGFGAEVGDQVSSEKVLAEFAAGATIVLQGLHRVWPPLIDFTRRLIDDIGHPAQVNAYVTPASSRGFDPHYDVHDVFVLQIAGEKHWRIHAPVHVDPLRDQPWTDHRAAVAQAALGEPVIDAVLRPGDALYLPRGWIHSATALGGTSVHLTVGMAAYTRADVVRALVSTLGEHEALRGSLPLGVDWSSPEAVRPLVQEVAAEMLAALGASASASSSDRSGADGVGMVSRAIARRFADATRPEPVAPLATVEAAAALGAASVVRWRGSLTARVESGSGSGSGSGTVRIVTASKTVALPAEAEAAVRRLHEGGPVELSELPGLDVDDAIVVVRRLLREAILVPA
ncbi:cupin domain-containing protein [Herbiconiux sp. P15]|uniref:cupin domain-containing protein n=1 Tax=Herbiconiux liukaitaii TaxID=3342799 RepID=UPI0035B903E5